MNIENVIQVLVDGKIQYLEATIDGNSCCVPVDPANRHYAAIMEQVSAGTLTIAEADNGE